MKNRVGLLHQSIVVNRRRCFLPAWDFRTIANGSTAPSSMNTNERGHSVPVLLLLVTLGRRGEGQ